MRGYTFNNSLMMILLRWYHKWRWACDDRFYVNLCNSCYEVGYVWRVWRLMWLYFLLNYTIICMWGFRVLHLMVTVIREKAYVIYYSVVNKHLEWLYHLIPSILGKGKSMWSILNAFHHKFPSRYARKVRYGPHLKIVQVKY